MGESGKSVSEVVNIYRDEKYNTPVLESHAEEVVELSNTDSAVALTDSLMNFSAAEYSKLSVTFNSHPGETPGTPQVSCSDGFNLISVGKNDAYEIESDIVAASTECLSVTEPVCLHQNMSLNNNLIEVFEDSQESASNEFELISQNMNPAHVNIQNCNSVIYDTDSELTDFKPRKCVDLYDNLNVLPECNNNNPQVKDEEFHDAVEFFKDPSSIAFLENAGTSTVLSKPMATRSSLYVKFDPLHANFSNQLTKSNGELINEAETNSGSVCEDEKTIEPKVIENAGINTSQRESLGDALILFDSPVGVKTFDSNQGEESVSEKKYTENELQEALIIQKLCHQEILLKKQQEFELELAKKQQEYEATINQLVDQITALKAILKKS